MSPHHEDPEEHPEDYWQRDDTPISWPWAAVGVVCLVLAGYLTYAAW